MLKNSSTLVVELLIRGGILICLDFLLYSVHTFQIKMKPFSIHAFPDFEVEEGLVCSLFIVVFLSQLQCLFNKGLPLYLYSVVDKSSPRQSKHRLNNAHHSNSSQVLQLHSRLRILRSIFLGLCISTEPDVSLHQFFIVCNLISKINRDFKT